MLKPKYILLTIFICIFSCFLYLFTQIQNTKEQLQLTKNNYAELKSLIEQIPAEQPQINQSSASLFYRLDEISKKLNLSQHIDSINPFPQSAAYKEKLELQLSNLYYDQCIAWINLWQAYPDIQIEQLSIQKNDNNFFRLTMSILCYE